MIIDNPINYCQSVSATMTYGRYPDLEKFRSHESDPRPVSLASTGTPGPRTFFKHSDQHSQRLSEAKSTSWPRKLHRSASEPSPQGSICCSRSTRFLATIIGCVMHHTYDDMCDKDPCRSAPHSSCTGSFRTDLDFVDLRKNSFFFAKSHQCARKSLIPLGRRFFFFLLIIP